MASDKPSTIPPCATSAESARSHRSPPSSRRATRPVVPSARPKRGLRATARATPTVTRSFVVEVLERDETPHDEAPPAIIARVTPTEHASTAAVQHGFRFGAPFMDAVSDLLVALARDDEHDEKK